MLPLLGVMPMKIKILGNWHVRSLIKTRFLYDQDALSLLVQRLGSDRLASRSEIEKLGSNGRPKWTR